MKFGQLIECNMRIIFLEKTYTKCGRETIPRRFSKELKLTISLDLQCNVLYILFLFYAKLRDIKNIETKQQTACIYLIQSICIKQKEIWNQFPCLIFCMIFEEKYFCCYLLLTDQISFCNCRYFMRYWVICVSQLFVNQAVTS